MNKLYTDPRRHRSIGEFHLFNLVVVKGITCQFSPILPVYDIIPCDDVDDYLSKWLDGSVTLTEWISFQKIDHKEQLGKRSRIPFALATGILATEKKLFKELTQFVLEAGVLTPFNCRFRKLAPEEQDRRAERDLNLIQHFLNGNLDRATEARLEGAFHITDPRKVLLQYEIREHHGISNKNFDIHHQESFLELEVLEGY